MNVDHNYFRYFFSVFLVLFFCSCSSTLKRGISSTDKDKDTVVEESKKLLDDLREGLGELNSDETVKELGDSILNASEKTLSAGDKLKKGAEDSRMLALLRYSAIDNAINLIDGSLKLTNKGSFSDLSDEEKSAMISVPIAAIITVSVYRRYLRNTAFLRNWKYSGTSAGGVIVRRSRIIRVPRFFARTALLLIGFAVTDAAIEWMASHALDLSVEDAVNLKESLEAERSKLMEDHNFSPAN